MVDKNLRFTFDIGIDTGSYSDELVDMIIKSIKHDVETMLVKQSFLVDGLKYSNIDYSTICGGVLNG